MLLKSSPLIAALLASTLLSACVLESSSPNADALAADAAAAKAQAVETQSDTKTQTETADAEALTTVELGNGFYMITGPGGNIGVLSGADGLFVIDDKFERNGLEIIQKLEAISDKPIKYVVNTHYHGDHTGSNAVMKTTGASVVAHENVKSRMGQTFENKIFNRTVEAVDPSLWPDETYTGKSGYKMNGQTIDLLHMAKGHTDGDTIIVFKEGKVVHMGDNYFNGLFPYVDVDSGGTLQGMIAAQTQVINMSDAETQIIPGHGPMATKDDLIKSRDMLVDIEARVKLKMDRGYALEDIIAANTLSDYSAYSSFIDEENMIKIAYYSLGGT